MTWKCAKCGREFSRQNQDHYCVKPHALPEAEERISWSMPTYWKGRNIIHFAASKKHLGLYPGDEATTVFAEELSGWNVSKGTIRIPYDQPLPAELIERIAKWCYEKYAR